MSVQPSMIDIKEFSSKKYNQPKTRKEIGYETSKKSFSKRSLKSKISVTKISGRLRRSLSRLLLQKEHDFKSQLEVFESSMTYFVNIGRYLGLFPNISDGKRYPILSRGYTIPIIICLSQLVIPAFIFIGLMYTSINVATIFHLSYYGTSFICSVLVIRLATKWQELINLIKAADLNEYIDPSVKLKCNLAAIAFISFAFLRNILSVASKISIVLKCDSSNITFYGQSCDWLFKYDVQYSLPFGIIIIILNMIATINLTYYQIFLICVSVYLQSILEQISLKIGSFECEYLSVTYWRTLRQDYSRATQLVCSFDEIVNGLVFTLFASSLYFVCLQILYVSRLMQDYKLMTTLTYNVYSTMHTIVEFFIVSLIVAKVHSSSLKVAPLLYNVSSQAYCIEVQRFIDQIQGYPVALTGLNFFYVTKDVILTMFGTIVTYELVLLQLK